MASNRILKELKDMKKDPVISCSAGILFKSVYFSSYLSALIIIIIKYVLIVFVLNKIFGAYLFLLTSILCLIQVR